MGVIEDSKDKEKKGTGPKVYMGIDTPEGRATMRKILDHYSNKEQTDEDQSSRNEAKGPKAGGPIQ